MILAFHDGAAVEDVERLLADFDLTLHRVCVGERTFVATSGDERWIPWDALRALPGVREVIEKPPAAYFASRALRAHDTVVNIGGVAVGGGRPVIIAGPCAVENERDTVDTAMAMRDAGVDIFRGGIFKPRTTPYNYQGIGRRGLDILAAVRERTGLPVMTEVMDASDIRETAAVCDALWVGARNMTNSALLKRLGQAGKPVMIKRGFASPIEELVRAAEFVIVHGNPDVVLCERGIQTFERYTRFTLDLAAVPALKELSHLPVIVDPSHGTGRRSLIETMARAAIAAGADGLMVESHVRPENMIKPGDDFQALAPAEVAAIVRTSVELREFLVGRPAPADARLQPQLG